MKIPSYETRLNSLFDEAFRTNDPPMLDWIALKFELKYLRRLFDTKQTVKTKRIQCAFCGETEFDGIQCKECGCRLKYGENK